MSEGWGEGGGREGEGSEMGEGSEEKGKRTKREHFIPLIDLGDYIFEFLSLRSAYISIYLRSLYIFYFSSFLPIFSMHT